MLEPAPTIDPIGLIRPRRKIEGASAVLLPFAESGEVDWLSFDAHVRRTADAGLIPAVNMDTGYAHLIDESLRLEILRRTASLLGGSAFLAGAFVADRPGSVFDREGYWRQMDSIESHGGTSVIFQSYGLTELDEDELVEAYAAMGRHSDRFVAFELATDFAPFGRIYSLEVYRELMGVRSCIGAKHSSLHREPEWLRIVERDRLRPDFKVYTGNDLAIDMVMYGSDYLLGLSTFAPDLFARRDAMWEAGDLGFFELNDLLQYLGFFAFRPPVPAYKHSAAQFLKIRNWISTDRTHPQSLSRPWVDRDVLRDIAGRLGVLPEP